jgi:hypothetical protein
MLRLAAGLKRIDNLHAPTAAGTRMRVSGGHVFLDLGGVWICARNEHVASFGYRLGFARTGEETVVGDAVEALGQDMQQETTDKLRVLEHHARVASGPSIL